MTKQELKEALGNMETAVLNDEERAKQSGGFIKLPSGVTHYEIKGEGENIVLVHGYATPYFIYDKLFEKFVNEGYRVLRYDLPGRGYSERTETDYTPEFFARNLDEITSAILGEEKFVLVGTSMGGTICSTYFAMRPEKVKKLVLLAPAGMDTFKAPAYMKMCRVKGVGEMLFYNIAGKLLLKKCASEMYRSSQEARDDYMRKFAAAAKYKGFLKCTLSSLRNTILRTDEAMKGYRAVGESGVPVLCIWGTKDRTMPYYQHTRLLEVCKQTKLITYEDSGHIFLYDEGERTAQDVLEFIREEKE